MSDSPLILYIHICMYRKKGDNVTYVVLMPRMFLLDLIIMKQLEKNPNDGKFYTSTGLDTSKISIS